MCTQYPGRLRVAPWTLSSLLALSIVAHLGFPSTARAQAVIHKVSQPTERIEVTANTSRILTLEHKIPRAQVNNPDLLTLTPLSPNQIQISAKKAGVTQVNLWDEQGHVYSVDVIIYGDVKELEMALKMQFPHASVHVYRYSNSLVLTGFVDRPDYVSRIVRLAEDYSPKVINNISVGGVQQILLHVRVMEVSRTKLRQLGVDWASSSGGGSILSSASEILSLDPRVKIASAITGRYTTTGAETMAFRLVHNNDIFYGFLDALRQNELLKILAEPTLVTVSGRAASFMVGGEFPILVPQSLGTVSIEFKKFGTQVDFLPIVLGNGNIRLEVRPRVSEPDDSRSVVLNGSIIPALRLREVDTGVEMKAGQTLALAGLVQNRIEAQNRGIPILGDLPWVGVAFRRVQETNNEIELLMLVRPEFAAALNPDQVPPGGPGLDTTSPNDPELYFRGYMEVPRCCPDADGGNGNGEGCADCQAGAQGVARPTGDDAPVDGAPSRSAPAPGTAGAAAAVIQPAAGGSSGGAKPGLSWQSSRRASGAAPPAGGNLRQPELVDRQDRPAQPAPVTRSNPRQAPTPNGLVGPIGYDVEK